MSKRLTPKREAQIRAIHLNTDLIKEPPLIVRDELLAEIDALREELDQANKDIPVRWSDPFHPWREMENQ